MKDRQETKRHEEVALRNAIAKFRALSKQGSIPKLGIFWIDDSGTLFSESVSLEDAEDYGESRIFDGSHFDLWSKAVCANPQWRDKEYEEVPRGRVVYKKDKKEFIVYMPKRIGKHKNKVINQFDLPVGHVKFDYSDEHYQMQ